MSILTLPLASRCWAFSPGEGVKGYQFTDEKLNGEDGIKPGSKVELQVELEEGYGGLEVTSENADVTFQIE